MTTLREESRKDFTSNGTLENINAGTLQRIADATELMAKRHSELLSEIDRLKASLAAARRNSEWHEARASANKGQATKWRNKFNALKSTT